MLILLLLVAFLVTGCSNAGGGGGASAAPPASAGNFLQYHLAETDRSQRVTERDVLLTFLPANQLGLGEEKKPIATLTGELAPVDGQPLAQDDFGLLYLPPASRKSNTGTKAGIVNYEKQWERWRCWVVQVREGDLTGQRYYESRTGLLVGYELNMDNPNLSKGFFRKALLTTTDIPGLL
jgi:hypothetical protein